ncbi:MAG: NAD(P)/FAD-dependent oxidoreductase, partial [Oscillospiraceae bacterium]|nr:NAD(P)/FAD-dependent oxidoreductase [Oscillospiraceae bacterium]
MKRYVIVGNGVAAARCIEGIRSVDTDGDITVVSEERHDVYCRPLISYYLEGKTDLERMRYRDAGFYSHMDCQVLYGRRAAHINNDARQIGLDDGRVIPYDALCLATGSSAFVPPFKGLETVPAAFPFMTLDDALALERAINETSRVLIVGAGLIGLKCAEGICGRTASVTVCDLADRVLSSILDSECAAMMQRHLQARGIRFMLGDSAEAFEGNRALMKSGKEFGFDVLVLAVGVRANTSLLKEIGGAVNRGMLVNGRMETSVEGIYAAGDCTEGRDISSGHDKVLAILPNASMQGYTAGVNMAGGSAVHDKGIPMNSIGFFGLHAMTAGTYEGEMYEEKTDTSIKRLFTKEDLLKGFILIGCDERAGIYTSMIRERTPLSGVDFDLMRKAATTAAFSGEMRRK